MLRKVTFVIKDYKESPASKEVKLNVEIDIHPAIKEGQIKTPATELSLIIYDTIQKFIKEKKGSIK